MKSKHWSIALLVISLISLSILGGITAYIDPFFHYHSPLDSLQYPLVGTKQRYFNDGIVRHFDYDTIITGSSVTANFLASECDELFDANTIKVTFDGATFTETHELIRRALGANKDIKLIISSLDDHFLFETWGKRNHTAKSPEYLYDNFLPNDISYLLNKDILCQSSIAVLNYSKIGIPTTSFDEYGFWGNWYTFGKSAVLQHLLTDSTAAEMLPLTDELRQCMIENLIAKTVGTAIENPETQFVYFVPPYSVVHWSNLRTQGLLDQTIAAYSFLSQQLIEIDNIKLFAFPADFSTTTDLDLYRDAIHFSPSVNTQILKQIRNGDYLLTPSNYESYWQEIGDFYRSYDYSTMFES